MIINHVLHSSVSFWIVFSEILEIILDSSIISQLLSIIVVPLGEEDMWWTLRLVILCRSLSQSRQMLLPNTGRVQILQ
jgi:hypothetical protein